MFYLMAHSDWLLTVIICLAMIVFFVGAHAIVLHLFPLKKAENEIASIVAHLVGMLYAVLLGFIAVSSWGDFDKAEKFVKDEQNAIADLYRVANDFSPDIKNEAQKYVLKYAKLMPEEEWPAMQKGGMSFEAYITANHLLEAVNKLSPQNLRESNIQQEAISLTHDFLDARRARLNTNTEQQPIMLWCILFIGATVVIGFTFCLRQTNYKQQLYMTGVLAFLIGLLFSLILEFEYPYRGTLSVSSAGWSQMTENIKLNLLY